MSAHVRVHRAAFDVLAVVEGIIAEYCDAVGVLVRDDRRQLEQYFAHDCGVWLATAGATSDGAEVVGCVGLRKLTSRSAACEVKRLYVREKHRGQRVADALMDALEAYAASVGYRFAYLDTKDDLLAAIRFYERRGYVACERYNDNPQATRFMRRQLR